MTDSNHREDDLRQREQQLEQRELELRLRELEIELSQSDSAVHPTTKHHEPKSSLKQWYSKATKIATFLGLVIITVVAIRLAASLVSVAIVGLVAWVTYKLFFENDRSQ